MSSTQAFTNIVTPDALQAFSGDVLLFDCRSRLGDPDWGRAAYQDAHIAGAFYLSLDDDLAAPAETHPAPPGEESCSGRGRHPLPERQVFADKMAAFGVNADTQVVCYDDAGGAMAARAWWMLRWIGHHNVAVLDGGLAAWPLPLTADATPLRERGNLTLQSPLNAYVDVISLQERIDGGDAHLLDARTQARWAGLEEPIDPVAGHIPGAACLPFQENLDADGMFLPAEQLAARFAPWPDPVICYCGSGVTACHNLLALHIAGREGILYADSWSGWITDPDRPVGGQT